MTDLPSEHASDPGAAVNDLADRFWESMLEHNPTLATFYGDERYSDRLEDPSPAGRARVREVMARTAAEAAAIPTDGLSTEDRITRDMLQVIAELQMEEDDQGIHQLRVVDQMGGPQQLMPQMTSFQPVDTPDRLEAFIDRLHAYPAFMAANADILREALASGLTAPSIVTERTIAQLERMLAIRIEDAIIPGSLIGASEADRERVRDIIRDVVYPADAAFLDTLRGEYRYASREEPGLWSAPNGEQLYRTAIRSWTTLEMEPEAIHQIEDAYGRFTGLSATLIHAISEDDLIQLLRARGGVDPDRAWALAELMREEALAYGELDNETEATPRLLKSLRLYLEVLDAIEEMPGVLNVDGLEDVAERVADLELTPATRTKLVEYYAGTRRFDRAENIVLWRLESAGGSVDSVKEAIAFYDGLAGFSELDLEEGGLSRGEVDDGLSRMLTLLAELEAAPTEA